MANRQILNMEELQISESFIEERNKNVCQKALEDCNPKQSILNRVPILRWLPEYMVSKDLVFDLTAGITVAILQIPQSIAYGFLANCPPICGIYCAFFGSIIYAIFGTSKHISVGTFAVVCLMVGKTVSSYSKFDEHGDNLDNPGIHSDIGEYKTIDILVTLTFIIALCQFIIFFLRLGMICNLLSGTLINAFSTACSVHIVISQLQELFGVNFKSYTGYFRNYYTLKRFFTSITTINYITSAMGIVGLMLLVINKEIFKPWLSKKCRFPLPMEVIVVIIAIILSFGLDMEQIYNVRIVKNIPRGIPEINLPKFEIFKHLFTDGIAISLVSYIVSQSINMIFSQKGNYPLDTNQEALTMALINLIGSFFLAVPVSTSLVRSHLQYNIGGVSQIAAIVTALILLSIILWVGPLFEYLPKCILSSVVLSAVYSSLFEIVQFIYFWRLSKIEGVVWLVSFLTVVIVDISFGMFAAIVMSIATICVRTFQPDSYLLGKVSNSETYLDLRRYKEAQEIPNILIFHYKGSYNYFSQQIFRQHLFQKTKINSDSIFMEINQQRRKLKDNESLPKLILDTRIILLDFSGISYMDAFAIENLQRIQKDYNFLGVIILLANVSGNIYDTIKHYEIQKKVDNLFKIFASINDAISYGKAIINN